MLIFVAYLTSFLILIVYMIPGFQAEAIGIKTVRDDYNKMYLATNIQRAGILMDSMSFAFYVVAVVKLILTAMTTFLNSKHPFQRLKTSNHTIISCNELSLSIQSFIICGYKTFVILLWQFYIPPTKFIYGVCYVLTIFEISYNPIMYYICIRFVYFWKYEVKIEGSYGMS